MDRAYLAAMLTDAAPALDARRLTQQPDGSWLMVDDVGGDLLLVLDEQVPRIVLSRDLGSLPAFDRPRACELMMTCNFAWFAHGGLRAAYDPDRDTFVLLLDVPHQALTFQALVNVLRNFSAAAHAWSTTLRGTARTEPEMLSVPSSDLLIRV